MINNKIKVKKILVGLLVQVWSGGRDPVVDFEEGGCRVVHWHPAVQLPLAVLLGDLETKRSTVRTFNTFIRFVFVL